MTYFVCPARLWDSWTVFLFGWTMFLSCRAVSHLNGVEFEGNTLKVDFFMERRGRGRGQRGGPGGAGSFGGMPGQGRQTDFPLRVLVQSDMVGAIIGRQGTTIRQITQQTRARWGGLTSLMHTLVGVVTAAFNAFSDHFSATCCDVILSVWQLDCFRFKSVDTFLLKQFFVFFIALFVKTILFLMIVTA